MTFLLWRSCTVIYLLCLGVCGAGDGASCLWAVGMGDGADVVVTGHGRMMDWVCVSTKTHAVSDPIQQVEKVSHATAMSLLSSFGPIKKVGPSLGSFSISAALLLAMLEEFAVELEGKAV